MSRIFIAVVAAAVMSGCAFTPQTVVIEPVVEVSATDIGGGKAVSVYVVDERESQELGRRGSGALRGAAITTEQDIADVFSDAIVSNLRKMGYEAGAVPAPQAATGASLLRVDIRSIEYETSTGFWTGGVHTRGAMKATATRDIRSYDKLYRVDEEARVVVVPGADSNEAMINASVSALLQEMFNDVELFRFLAE
ncbi:MAG: YajG family lipoprotein [Woeseiaceae bacterium]|nr:YajG family lipoprotein [Woeseiaceae bacterium]